MSAQTESRRQDNQAVKVLLAMATFASAAVAIASALFWDDLTSAAVFGFLTAANVWMLATVFRGGEQAARILGSLGDRPGRDGDRAVTSILLLAAAAVWGIATLFAVGVSIQSEGSSESLVWVAGCVFFSLVCLLSARRLGRRA